MKSNIALSYILMLTTVGFFLWIIRNFIRGLRQKDLQVFAGPLSTQSEVDEKIPVNWSVHIFLSKRDDIPIPGRLVYVSPTDAFMESSANLKTGQEVSLYVDVPGHEQLRFSVRVVWAREGLSGKNAAQLCILGQSFLEKRELFRLALGRCAESTTV